MRNLNRITLLGNVGKAPEVRVTETGKAVVNFQLATTERYTDASGTAREHTEWHRIVAWEGLAELIGQYVGRGDPLFVEGQLRHREYDDAEGIKRYVTEIEVRKGDHVVFLSRSRAGQAAPPPAAA